jgi:hypothetical protein
MINLADLTFAQQDGRLWQICYADPDAGLA